MKRTPANKISDEILVTNFKNGDERAFDDLVKKYQNLVLNSCFHFLGEKADAEDAAQDVFVKVYSSLYTFSTESRFTTWLYRVVVNHCLNIKRSKKRRRIISLFLDGILLEKDEPVDLKTPAHIIERDEQNRAVHKALDKLKEDQRVAIVLYNFQGLSYKEIAQVQKCSVAAVEARIFRGKSKLAEILKKIEKI